MIIVPFSLELMATELTGLHPAQQAAFCRRIVAFWAPHGVVVVLGGAEGRARFREAIEALPQQARAQWKSALQRFRERLVFADGPDVEQILEPADLDAVSGIVGLIGAADERCDLLGFDINEIARTFGAGPVEVARLLCVGEAPVVQDARKHAVAELEYGATREDIWNERFQPLVQYSRQLVVVDRYCGNDAVRHSSDGRSGLEFVLRKVWLADLRVKILLATPRSVPSEEPGLARRLLREAIAQMVDRLCVECGSRTRDLEIFRVDDRVFSDWAHDRYMRFSSWVYRLDVGLESFSGTGPRRRRSPCELTHCSVDELHARQELELSLMNRSGGVLRLRAGDVRAEGCD